MSKVKRRSRGPVLPYDQTEPLNPTVQQFFGHWAIDSGKLHIEYRGERNWVGNSWFEKLLSGMKSQPLNINEFDLTFDADSKSLKLTELSEGKVSNLILAGE